MTVDQESIKTEINNLYERADKLEKEIAEREEEREVIFKMIDNLHEHSIS